VYEALRHARAVLVVCDGAVRPAWVLELGLAEFTRFTGAKVQILTQKALHQVRPVWALELAEALMKMPTFRALLVQTYEY